MQPMATIKRISPFDDDLSVLSDEIRLAEDEQTPVASPWRSRPGCSSSRGGAGPQELVGAFNDARQEQVGTGGSALTVVVRRLVLRRLGGHPDKCIHL